MFIKLNEDEAADKSRVKTAQVLVSHCTELQTEEGLSHRALFSALLPNPHACIGMESERGCREWLARSRCGTKTITQETASSSATARIGTLYLMRMKRPFARGESEPLQTQELSYPNMFSH